MQIAFTRNIIPPKRAEPSKINEKWLGTSCFPHNGDNKKKITFFFGGGGGGG